MQIKLGVAEVRFETVQTTNKGLFESKERD